MSINTLSFDMFTGEPVLLLKDSSSINSFLINGNNQDIGFLMSELSGSLPDASSPYALFISVVSSMGGKVKRLEISASEDIGHPNGLVYISHGATEIMQKCRPVDIAVLSNKLSLPIQVASNLIGGVNCSTMVPTEGACLNNIPGEGFPKIDKKFIQ